MRFLKINFNKIMFLVFCPSQDTKIHVNVFAILNIKQNLVKLIFE